MLNATFTAPDLDTFSQLDRLGLTVTGQLIEPHRSVLECRVLEPDNWCHGCGQQGVSRGTVIRRLAHVPLGWRPTTLQVRVRRYRCPDCRSVWRQDTSTAAEPRAVLSRHAALWALKGVVIDRLSVARIAAGLAVAWNTANDAILATGQQLLINDPTRLDGVRVIGVDEHVWSHTRRGSK
ncbi:transposase family protein, partial [Brachybacterium paraconglomeratum]|uniref:transposase family protein n=1 Tax=Brachybacterium paraconglomeratum TaxID=173362 RepID=UPI0022AF4500